MKKYKILADPSVKLDLKEAIDYLETKRKGPGKKFLAEYKELLKTLEQNTFCETVPKNKISIYRTSDSNVEVEVIFEKESIWLDTHVMATLFDVNRPAIVKHIQNIYKSEELNESSTCAKIAQVRQEGKRLVTRNLLNYNLDAILCVGYRVNSKRGTQFQQWATQRLKEYLVQGDAINEKRLAEKQQQVEHLKTGIRILSRAITQQVSVEDSEALKTFANGLQLLDDYDHEQLDPKGKTAKDAQYPSIAEYLKLIDSMKSDFNSAVFAKPKDHGFESGYRN
ncbi:virulence RhuM family protein [Sphingobacterium faecale]|uniref:Virulence RhuM family protein n=1 Tax=Sphingobacterium faecale TaxID=2803775 RepID=A0ABS1R1U5_9SPHI|nr:RhuM family protein [Sphingobacterium faecale]MBL1408234.1 virulence RhuM family protein [Sphingobacterium faecale]